MAEHERKDDILIGQLIANVATLTAEVNALRQSVTDMQARINTGSGMFIGAIMLSGGIGATASHLIERLLR